MEGPATHSGEVGAPDDMLALLEGMRWISLLGDNGRLRRARHGEGSDEARTCFFCRWSDVLSSD